MKRFAIVALLATMVMGFAMTASAATEVKMRGDALIFGTYSSGKNFTGWNAGDPSAPRGTKTEDTFWIHERFRLRSDFVANEAVKFRLGIKVEDDWGHGTFTAANPSASIQVYQAFLQFKVPNSEVEVTAGLQDLSLPTSAFFCDSVVFGGTRAAALVINAPLTDYLTVIGGFSRMIDRNQYFETTLAGNATTTQSADELDMYFLTLPITVDGFKATPWGAIAVAGKDADYSGSFSNDGRGSYGNESNIGQSLLSANAYSNGLRDNQNAFWWAGATFEVTTLDPVRFYADVIYGAGGMNDRNANKRRGWFIDFGAEYTGFEMVTPQVFGWWSTGEDNSTSNGSERMPSIVSNWGPGNSFLFDGSQELVGSFSNMGVNPIGAWGFGASLNNITFMEKLSHRLTFTYLHGNNSARALRRSVANNEDYYIMGRDLTVDEHLVSISLDTTYQIYESLAAVLETGWAHGNFKSNVWGHRFAANGQDAWKVSLGLSYKF